MLDSHLNQSIHPIHQPCPDMAGCEHFDHQKLNNSLKHIEHIRTKYGLKNKSLRQGGCDFRYSREYQTQARRAFLSKGGVL